MRRKVVGALLFICISMLSGCGNKKAQETEAVLETEIIQEMETEEVQQTKTALESSALEESTTEEEMKTTEESKTEKQTKNNNLNEKKTPKKEDSKEQTVIEESATPKTETVIPPSQEQPLDKKEQNNNNSGSKQESSNGSQNSSHDNSSSGTPDSKPSEPSEPVSEYQLVWEDNFDGDTLNEADWNYELHEPGWVNNELQEYTASEENTYVKDGILIIQAIKTIDENGNVSYTSGRINTQNKHDFKYGKFEARAKVPSGKGFLPAFWMMPTNENLYGQWPKCGEIDIMEVLGDDTDKTYATLHFGEPHTQKQGSSVVSGKDFAEEFHTYTCEWNPGEIKFYVDGKLFHTVNDWFTKKPGFDEVAYPAPYDQPFYMILNLAVGGNWPGNPDDTTTFDEKAQLQVDYVKVYRKNSYDENVDKPVEELTFREPDATGNYIVNGDFAKKEKLDDDKAWGFLLAGTGKAAAEIKDKALHIVTEDAGNLDYSVQVVQPNLPMEQGYRYKVSFDAYAGAKRTMKTGITAPDNGYIRYLEDIVVNLTTDKKNYEYEFNMTDKSDVNGRLEFNLGNQGSAAEVIISNVRVEKLGKAELPEAEKTVLPDGNYVYNGTFDQGSERLAYWTVNKKNSAVQASVTNDNNVRELKVSVPDTANSLEEVIVEQKDIAITGNKDYVLSFTAHADAARTIKACVAGQEFDIKLTSDKESYKFAFHTEEGVAKPALQFLMGTQGTMYIDDVRIQEDGMLVNGDFSNGLTGYEVYKSDEASVTYGVDSLKEDGAACFDISDTGSADWMIQLKQNNVTLEEGKWYSIKFDAKSDKDRAIMYALQRDGSADNDWTPYSGSNVIQLTNEYQTFEKTFQMTSATDEKTILSISMGAVLGTRITDKHIVAIKNIALEETSEPESKPEEKTEETTDNMIQNGDFGEGENQWEVGIYAPAEGSRDFSDGKAVFTIDNPGEADWNAQMKQHGLNIEKGATYKISFDIESTASRTVKYCLLTKTYDWYGGADIELTVGESLSFEQTLTIEKDSVADMDFVLSFGKIDGVDTPASTIIIDNICVEKVADAYISETLVALAAFKEVMTEAETEEVTETEVTESEEATETEEVTEIEETTETEEVTEPEEATETEEMTENVIIDITTS